MAVARPMIPAPMITMGREESREGDILFVSSLVRLSLFYGLRVRGLFIQVSKTQKKRPDTLVRNGDEVIDRQY